MAGLKNILDEIEAGIGDTPSVSAWLCNKYIAASMLQKAIRRNEVERAMMAASALWRQDRRSFWRRLHVVALEDVGAASPDVVIKVLTAVSASSWRRRVGDERVAIYLTRLLCGAVKTRLADELFIQAEQSPGYNDLREKLSKADDDLLADYAAHENNPLIERAISLWCLAGTKKFPSDVMPGRVGSPDKVVKVLRGLDVPVDLIESCISVIGKTSWPLSIFTPLIWQEIRKQPKPLYTFYDPIPVAPEVEGIPLYAADMFTRTGQASFRQLQKAVSQLKQFTVRQIGLGLFYLEGRRIDKALTSEVLNDFRQQGEITDVESAGLCLPEYLGLRELLTENMEVLDDIRCKQLQRSLNEEEQ
ncbi:MAG: hypothetical protein DHS20C02_12040 [Micavibrio sp.]|nr:MAG: hypothetical protein DHS20C02_12040 [Micavibrio sp.]